MWILFGLDSNKITVKTHDWGDVTMNLDYMTLIIILVLLQ